MNLEVFKHNQFGAIRTAQDENGEPLFCLADVCNILDISNNRDVKSRLNPKGVVNTDTLTAGGKQKVIFVNESNFYKVVFQSRKAEADQFTDWVTSEVLPSIRKHGMYATPDKIEDMINNPEAAIKMLSEIQRQRTENLKLKELNKNLGEVKKVIDTIIDNDQLVSMSEAAKILQLPYGRNTLFRKLRENGVFFKEKNEPKQQHVSSGLFEMKEKVIERTTGYQIIKITLVTQKGLIWLGKLLNKQTQGNLGLA